MKTRLILTSLAFIAVGGCGSDSVDQAPTPVVDRVGMVVSGPITYGPIPSYIPRLIRIVRRRDTSGCLC